MARRITTLIALSFVATALTACKKEATSKAIKLEWNEGDSFHVAASYRIADVMGEETPVSLEDGQPMADNLFGDRWTDEVVWTYKVVEEGFKPDASDELYPYALTGTGKVAPLAVIKVTVDPTLNTDPDVLEADPVTYLVFREDRDRLAGIISYVSVAGERVERAWSSHQTGRSWSVLSQSNLTNVPTYLAPFSATWGDSDRKLESGREVYTLAVDKHTADVFYDDELDGNLVASRYEKGAPWPTWTVAQNMEARLLDESEVEDIRASLPFLYPEEPEQFDYRAALGTSIDIDAALTIDADTVASSGWHGEARDGFKPWAGSWWNLRDGALVFGFETGNTISKRIRDTVDPIKTEMDTLSSDIRDMSDGADKDEKVKAFQDKQSELVEKLVAFYDGIQADLDAGKLRVADGKITHEDGWSYDLDDLSPMDKFALVEYLDGNAYPNPFYMPAWEILNSYNPGGEGWWGHCNGWSGAAILANEPRDSETVSAAGNDFTFSTGDMKGLLTEAHYSTYSHFYGERYNDEKNDLTDLTPKAFQNIVSFYIKEQGVPLVFDTTADEQVWNFPAYSVDLSLNETTDPSSRDLVNINTATVDDLAALPGIGESLSEAIVEYREANGPFQSKEDLKDVDGIGDSRYADIEDLVTVNPIERSFDVSALVKLATDGVDETHVDTDQNAPSSISETWGYTLVTDEQGVVLSGKWDRDDHHPDFAWVPYSNPHSASSGSSENPYLDYGHLLDAIGTDFERK